MLTRTVFQAPHTGAACAGVVTSVLFRASLDRYHEAVSLTRLGEAVDADGDPEGARAHWRAAIDIFDDLHHPEAAALRARLAS